MTKGNKKPILDLDKFRYTFVKETLRKASFRWPGRQQAIKAARVYQAINTDTGRLCWFVMCAKCALKFPESQLGKEGKLDHIEPVIPTSMLQLRGDENTRGWASAESLGQLVLRMFPESSGFNVLCTGCHAIKTKGENDERKASRDLYKLNRK